MLHDYLNENARKRILLCHTLAGNRCEYIHLSDSKVHKKKHPKDEGDLPNIKPKSAEIQTELK
jgi:hypothetical protein